MSQNLQLVLLVLVIVILYLISSRWKPGDESQRAVRISYWIGLIVILLGLVLYTVLKGRNA